MTADKVTIRIPHELKEKLLCAKDELNISMSAIYKEALENYLAKKESEKWKKGFELAAKDDNYTSLCNELGDDDGGIYEY